MQVVKTISLNLTPQSVAPVVCPVGKYSLTLATACTHCGAGYVCPQGRSVP